MRKLKCGREISISAVFKTQWHNYENIIKSIFYKPLVLLAHPAGVEPATLSTAN